MLDALVLLAVGLILLAGWAAGIAWYVQKRKGGWPWTKFPPDQP